MPTYDYRCAACGHALEVFQSISAAPKRKCPACGRAKLERQIGAGAGFLFKGSGFYSTDYRSKSYSEGAKSDASAKADASAARSDGTAKPDSTAKPDGTASKPDAKTNGSPDASKSDAAPRSDSRKPASDASKSKPASDAKRKKRA